MKRLTALLLALLLPLSAAAEAYSFSVSFNTDETLFPQFLQETIFADSDALDPKDEELTIRFMQALLDGLSLGVHTQDDLTSVTCYISGNPLFDFQILIDDKTASITSSLIPDSVFVMDVSTESVVSVLNAALDKPQRKARAANSCLIAADWFAGLEQTSAAGAFHGDAYEGGVTCKTWKLTDSDIADLLSRLLTDDVRRVISAIAESVEAYDLLEHFDTLNTRVAEADVYQYVLRAVENEKQELCGVSLTILHDVKQIATASIGLTKSGMKLVIGLGLQGDNYWWEFTADRQIRKNITTWTGVSREWLAAKELSFDYVAANIAPVSDICWECDVTKLAKTYLWNAAAYEELGMDMRRYLLTSDGKVNTDDMTFDVTLALGQEKKAPLSVRVKLAAAYTQTIDLTDLQPIAVDESFDVYQYQDLVDKASALLAVRLLKILPADLYVTLLRMNTGN